MRFLLPLALWLATLLSLPAAQPQKVGPWDLSRLYEVPKTYPGPAEYAAEGVESFFYETLDYQGKPTRSFAYLGLPKRQGNERVPAMVLVHGGGGTAFAAWVKLWNSRGYAAIAMDTCGALPGGEHSKRPRHEWGGPRGWGGLDQTELPLTEQWSYHAVADVVLAHSLLRSRPEVDSSRIGLTGISWGGYLTSVVAGVDDRFRFAAPVYGCGFLVENSTWLPQFTKMSPAGREIWRTTWDPSAYLARARRPMLWVTGTNDFAFPLDSLQKSYRLAPGTQALSVRLRMPHGQNPGAEAPEILALANHLLRGARALPELSPTKFAEGRVSTRLKNIEGLQRAELLFTKSNSGPWKERLWESEPVEMTAGATALSAAVPPGAVMAYFNVADEQGAVWSSEHVELPPPPTAQ